MALTLAEVLKNAKTLELLKAHMKGEHNIENLDFVTSKDGNEKLYGKFVSSKSATQVNLPSATQTKLDELAGKKKWSDMGSMMATAKTQITALINSDVMKRFEVSGPYKAYLESTQPAKPDLTAATAAARPIDADMNDGAKYFTAATASVKTKGVPGDKEEVNRMFESGRMRHDKVHNAFTALLQKDKAFTRANFGPFFTKKDAYSKMWAEYRKLLGK